MKHIGCFLIFGVFFLGFSHVSHAGIIEFFFPTLRKDETAPTPDGRAPFAAKEGEKKGALFYYNAPPKVHEFKDVIPLNKPHVQTSDIQNWAMMTVAEALTFDDPDPNVSFKATADSFAPDGRKQYKEFLKVERFLDVLKNRRYVIRSFVEEPPLLLNEGVVDGRYRWLFEVRVMLSFMDKNMDDYAKADAITQEAIVSIQVGRSSEAENKTGVFIDQWKGRVLVDKKKTKQ